jgi:hypothetical protein
MLGPVAAAIFALASPIVPNDFWYHARAGGAMAQTHSIPTLALFTSSAAPGAEYFYQNWFAELLLYQTLESGGLVSIVLLRAGLLTIGIGLVQWAAWRRLRRAFPDLHRRTTARVIAASTLLIFALSSSNMDIRPQN